MIDAPGFQKHGTEAIAFLVQWGADTNQKSVTGNILYHQILAKQNLAMNTELTELFWQYGLDLDQLDQASGGQSALMKLAQLRNLQPGGANYQTQMINKLLTLGADPNLKDNQGRTALHLAIRWANVEAVKLLAPVTELSISDSSGATSLEYAQQRLTETSSVEERLALIEIIKSLE